MCNIMKYILPSGNYLDRKVRKVAIAIKNSYQFVTMFLVKTTSLLEPVGGIRACSTELVHYLLWSRFLARPSKDFTTFILYLRVCASHNHPIGSHSCL